jgi:hypothetical protein
MATEQLSCKHGFGASAITQSRALEFDPIDLLVCTYPPSNLILHVYIKAVLA